MGWRQRTFFIGEGIDDRLMAPLDPGTVPDGEAGQCRICLQSLRDGAPVALPCHAAHRFHTECVVTWMSQGPAFRHCPFCRVRFRIVTYQEWNRQSEDFVRFFVNYQPRPDNEDEEEN